MLIIANVSTRLVHPEGSLADLTMLSASSADASLSRGKEEEQDAQGEQTLVTVTDESASSAGETKPGSLSDARQSSTDDSQRFSMGTDPEPSTEQSSGMAAA